MTRPAVAVGGLAEWAGTAQPPQAERARRTGGQFPDSFPIRAMGKGARARAPSAGREAASPSPSTLGESGRVRAESETLCFLRVSEGKRGRMTRLAWSHDTPSVVA